MNKCLIIIPAYNEEENIEKTVNNIIQNKNYDYVVINDGSNDNTLNVLKKNKFNYINLTTNLGIGGAVQTGYKYAYENGYEIAVQFDGDGQHDIDYVSKICEPLINSKIDMCIGSRYLDKSESKFQSTFMRRFGASIITLCIRIFCHKKITDPTSGFRAVNRNVIEKFANEYPTEYPEPESTVQLLVNKFSVEEVSVSMNERKGGVSSIRFGKTVDYMLKVILAIIIDSISFKRKGGK